jgi:arabinose-5-phosphate isomerase
MSGRETKALKAGREVLREAAACLGRAADSLGDDFVSAAEALSRPDSFTIVIGVGKSGHIGNKLVAGLTGVGHRAVFIHPQEALHGDLGMASHATLAILLSHSGNTEELMVLAPALKEFDCRIALITAFRDCALARYSDWVIETRVDEEAGLHRLAPTSSSTTTLSVGDALMIASVNLRGFTVDEFRRYHPGGLLGKKLKKVRELMTPVERLAWLHPDDSIFDVLETVALGRRGFGVVARKARGDKVRADEVGVISDGDIRNAARDREGFHDKTAAAIMTGKPTAIDADALMGDALRLMETYRYSFLLCTDADGLLVGAVQIHDLVASDLDITARADRLPNGGTEP